MRSCEFQGSSHQEASCGVGGELLNVDGHPAHRAAAVKRSVESSQGRLRLFYLVAHE